MKVCSKCGRELDETMFYKDKSKKDGLSTQCKKCKSGKAKQWSIKNRDSVNACRRRRYLENNEERRERARAYYANNKDRIKENRLRYLTSEKGKNNRKETIRKYTEANKEKIRAKSAEYRENNKDRIREYGKQYKKRACVKQREKDRLNTDEIYRVKQKLRKLVSYSFSDRRSGYGKDTSTEKIIGCTFEEAKERLERTWLENY